jgi:hypothetical protein
MKDAKNEEQNDPILKKTHKTHLWWDICIQTFETRFKGSYYMAKSVCIHVQYKNDVAVE